MTRASGLVGMVKVGAGGSFGDSPVEPCYVGPIKYPAFEQVAIPSILLISTDKATYLFAKYVEEMCPAGFPLPFTLSFCLFLPPL